jgi:hypothetical protein
MLTTPLGQWMAGPFLVACALLVFSGATKLARPAGTRQAASAIGLPSSRIAVLVLAVVEVALGVMGAVFGAWSALGVAVFYGLLALTVVRLLRRAPDAPCGCLGSTTSTASRTHVLVNTAAAAVSLVAATNGSPLAEVSGGVVTGLLLAALVAVAVALVQLVMEGLPELARLTHSGSS